MDNMNKLAIKFGSIIVSDFTEKNCLAITVKDGMYELIRKNKNNYINGGTEYERNKKRCANNTGTNK